MDRYRSIVGGKIQTTSDSLSSRAANEILLPMRNRLASTIRGDKPSKRSVKKSKT